MNDAVLKATVRDGTAKQVRDAGCIPGVLHTSDATSTSVQFEAGALSKLIAQHGSKAKVSIQLENEKSQGFIKEVQRSPVEGKVIHIVIQVVKKGQKVKMPVSIAFHGRDELENRQLQLQVQKSDVELSGKADQLPNVITVDVTGLEVNDCVTPANIKLPKGIELLDPENEVYAVVKPIRRAPEPEEIVAEAEAEAAAEAAPQA